MGEVRVKVKGKIRIVVRVRVVGEVSVRIMGTLKQIGGFMLEILDLITKIIRHSYPELNEKEVQIKAMRWYDMPNMNLGNISPRSLVDRDRKHKVIYYLECLIDEEGVE